jgi:hypothetical protein
MRPEQLVAALMLVSALTAPTFGQTPPTGYRDVTWGATPQAVVRSFPTATCFNERTELSDWRCILLDETVNTVSADVVLYGYYTGTAPGLAGFAVSFDATDAARIVDAFVSSYGPWSRKVETEVVTKSERRFASVTWAWEFPDVEIRIGQDRERLGNGQALVMSRAGLAESLARDQE